eukprot:3654316-Amphidinium_carterae.2
MTRVLIKRRTQQAPLDSEARVRKRKHNVEMDQVDLEMEICSATQGQKRQRRQDDAEEHPEDNDHWHNPHGEVIVLEADDEECTLRSTLHTIPAGRKRRKWDLDALPQRSIYTALVWIRRQHVAVTSRERQQFLIMLPRFRTLTRC